MPKWVLKTPLSYTEVGQNYFSQSIHLKSLHAGSRIDVFYPLFPPLPSYFSEKIEQLVTKSPVGLSKPVYGACEANHPVCSLCSAGCHLAGVLGSLGSNLVVVNTLTMLERSKAIEYTFRANGSVKVWTDLTDVARQTALAGVCA